MNLKETVRILVVDDNIQNLKTVVAILTSEGYEIITTRSGNEALRYLLNHEVAVIILDVVMPGMGGFDFAKVLRERKKTSYTPIIFTSGLQVDETNVSLGYELGAIDYITLPLVPQILRAKVQALVSLHQREKELVRKIEKVRELEKRQYEQRMELINQERVKEKERQEILINQEKTAALEKSNQELNRFSTIVAHDLQEPLRTISRYVALLKQELKEKIDPKSKEQMEFIVDASKRMSKLITDLLRYSQVDHSKDRKKEICQLDDILKKAKENLNAVIEQREVVITASKLPSVLGDEVQLVQVIQNLISNAIKFCPEKSPEIMIECKGDGNLWKFSVHDNGIGIPSKHLYRVFNAFERFHDKKLFQGTGVGLAICKRIIESHGGRIWVESEENQGTTFFFVLPKDPMELKSPNQPNAQPNVLSGMRLLVVDDDTDTSSFLKAYFARMGVQVETCASGESGLDKALSYPFDAMVLDIQMPGIDGFETMARLTKNGFKAPTVAYTGIDIASRGEDFKKAGFAHVVNKSAGPMKLEEYFRTAYKAHQAA